VPGNTLTGWISDRVPARVCVFASCTGATLAVLVLWGMGNVSPGLLIAFSIVWGLTALSFVALWSKMISRICKEDPTLSVLMFSMFAVLRGVGNLTSGPISTELLKTGVFRGAAGAYGATNFGAVLVYTSVTIFVGGCVGLFFPK
jgi:predicted MFS family arabinose efflux permease